GPENKNRKRRLKDFLGDSKDNAYPEDFLNTLKPRNTFSSTVDLGVQYGLRSNHITKLFSTETVNEDIKAKNSGINIGFSSNLFSRKIDQEDVDIACDEENESVNDEDIKEMLINHENRIIKHVVENSSASKHELNLRIQENEKILENVVD